jgi:hypothetical protein
MIFVGGLGGPGGIEGWVSVGVDVGVECTWP